MQNERTEKLLRHHQEVAVQVRSLSDKLSVIAAGMSRVAAVSLETGTEMPDLETVAEWGRQTEPLSLGSKGPDVAVLEYLLRAVGGLYSGAMDDEYGKLCRKGVMEFQQYRLLPETGVADAETRALLATCYGVWSLGELYVHPLYKVMVYGPWRQTLGYLPDVVLGVSESGKISSFGGPHDSGDRIYNQAYITSESTPRKLLQRHQQLVDMGVLMSEEQMLAVTDGGKKVLESLDEWPKVTDWRGNLKTAGVSWALNPDGFYCAMRWKKRGGMVDAGNPKLLVWTDDKAVVVLRTDWGPAVSTHRVIDLSPGALRALGLKTDKKVSMCWADDDLPLGPVHG